MSQSSMDRMRKIVAEHLGVSEDDVVPEEPIMDFGATDDPNAVTELIRSLEEEFSVVISNEDAAIIHTVQDAMDYLNEHAQ